MTSTLRWSSLADWITKLLRHMVQVWVVQAWNMAYNISCRMPRTRRTSWRWVRAGMELLRDQALKYNPDEPLIYGETGVVLSAQNRRREPG